jgi:RimJ/RimL family protein N-acetyltransferase
MHTYKPMALHLVTERLVLGPWTESDAELLCALHAERGVGTHPIERAREIIAAQLDATARTGIALLPMRRHGESDFIGYCGLVVGRSTVDEPEIAYELFQHAHGHGYATEAARAVVDAAIATGRTRLWSTVGGWNTPSLRVLEKLGFERDHTTIEDGKGEIVWLTRKLP